MVNSWYDVYRFACAAQFSLFQNSVDSNFRF